MEITLGTKYADAITGFTGTATGDFNYLGGYHSAQLETLNDDGEVITDTFDVERLIVIPVDVPAPVADPTPAPLPPVDGGPVDPPLDVPAPVDPPAAI
jgi:hypothetical protein